MTINARLIGCLLMAASVLAGLVALAVVLVQALGWWCVVPVLRMKPPTPR
jgi:hypothetical protein